MRRLPATLVAAALGAAIALPAQGATPVPREPPPDSGWAAHVLAASEAYRRGDFSIMRAELLAARRLAGPLPHIDYHLAVAEARLGNRGRALEWLETWADMGLWKEIESDRDLSSLHGMPGFARIGERVEANRTPVVRGAAFFTLHDPDLIAEDLAYDPDTHRFFVSSVRERRIIVVDSLGGERDFVAPGASGVWGIFALGVDAPRHLVWATTAAMTPVADVAPADTGRSALLAYDLATGALRHRIDAPRGTSHVLGDLTIGADGTVFVSDAVSGAVFEVRAGTDSLAILVAPGALRSPQTPALDGTAKRLFVPDYSRGIAVVNLASGALSWLGHPGNVALVGIDGLYRVGHDLIAIQNGTSPDRVLRLRMDDAMSRVLGADVIERGTPPLDDPTHGVLVGDTLYFIANSGWSRVRDNGAIRHGTDADRPVVRRIVGGW